MPRDRDFKRRVRARMQKTGEAYTTARSHLLDTRETTKPAAVSAPEPLPDYAGVAGMSDATIEAKTGRTWAQWVVTLDQAGAHRMKHRDIARLVNEQHGVDGWWSQTVTVGYERIKGLRERGQQRGGAFEASKSKTFAVPVTTLFDACADDASRRRWLDGAAHELSTATRPRSIRLRWNDGTLVAFWFMEKAAEKSSVSVQHTKLPDRAAADRMKQYWAERLAALAELLPRL